MEALSLVFTAPSVRSWGLGELRVVRGLLEPSRAVRHLATQLTEGPSGCGEMRHLPNKALEQTVGAMRHTGAPPAAQRQRSADAAGTRDRLGSVRYPEP